MSELARAGAPVRLGVLEPVKSLELRSRRVLEQFEAAGARLLVGLCTRDQLHGVLAVGPKRSEEEFSPSDAQLVHTLANQGAVALENARLLHERARQIELEKELEIARRVQLALIPAELPAPSGWRIAARCVPARQVGGDFFDALAASSNGAGEFIVGDVAGKSVAGAMLMVAAREVLQTAALGGISPEQLFEVANRRLYTPRHRLFVALAYLQLRAGGEAAYALAGQPTPLVRRYGGAVAELPAPQHRLPVGALRGVHWDLMPLQMSVGDVVVLYSDGVTDARNPAGESFGEERLQRILSRAGADPTVVVDKVLGAVAEFAAGGEPYDDVTLLAAQWVGLQ